MCVDVPVVYLAVRWVSRGVAHSQSVIFQTELKASVAEDKSNL